MVPLFESLHTDVKLVVTVTDWMWFPWLRHVGLVTAVTPVVLLMWFVAIATSCECSECDSGHVQRPLVPQNSYTYSQQIPFVDWLSVTGALLHRHGMRAPSYFDRCSIA